MSLNSPESSLLQFSREYTKIHGRILFPLTIFGFFLSLITILILRKEDFRTPANFIVQRIVFFRALVLISYSIYSFYFYLLRQPRPFVGQSIFWPCFLILHSNVGVTAHSIAFWLTCLLAMIQLIIVSKPNQTVIGFVHVSRLTKLLVLVTCLLMIPNYLTWSIIINPAYLYLPNLYAENASETIFWISTKADERFEKNSFVILALVFKILPLLILIIFSLLLISNLRQSRPRARHQLPRITISSSSSLTTIITPRFPTTKIVLFIILLTILIELPQGLLFVFSGFNAYFFSIYSHLADIWDLTSVGTSFITFLVYFSISGQFRLEFWKLFLRKTNDH